MPYECLMHLFGIVRCGAIVQQPLCQVILVKLFENVLAVNEAENRHHLVQLLFKLRIVDD